MEWLLTPLLNLFRSVVTTQHKIHIAFQLLDFCAWSLADSGVRLALKFIVAYSAADLLEIRHVHWTVRVIRFEVGLTVRSIDEAMVNARVWLPVFLTLCFF